MKSSAKIAWKTEITFLLSETLLFFLKYIWSKAKHCFSFLDIFEIKYIYAKIKYNTDKLHFFQRQILKNIDMPRQMPGRILNAAQIKSLYSQSLLLHELKFPVEKI